MINIAEKFEAYQEVTGDDTAAAILVLAEIVRDKQMREGGGLPPKPVKVCSQCYTPYVDLGDDAWKPMCDCDKPTAEGVKAT